MEANKKWKKRVAAGAAAAVATAGMLVNNTVADPATLIRPKETDPVETSHLRTVDSAEHRSYFLETDRDEPFTLREKACLWMQSLPLPVRALILLPLWGIGEMLTVALSALWHSPVGQALLHFLLEVGLLIGLFALVWKLLFPNVPLSKLFSKKNLPWILLGAALLTVANWVLGLVWEDWKIWRIALLAVCGLEVLALLWWRLFRKMPLPQRRKQRVELIVQ